MITRRLRMLEKTCEVCEVPAWMEFSGREWNGKGWVSVSKNLCRFHAGEWLKERRKNNKIAKVGV